VVRRGEEAYGERVRGSQESNVERVKQRDERVEERGAERTGKMTRNPNVTKKPS